MTTVLVIGGGFAGLSTAQLLSEKGWQVTLVERSNFLGGGNKTFYYGGHPYTFGPRLFLTQDESLFEFLHAFVPMRKIPEHEFLTYVEKDEQFYNFPIHRDDVDLMPDKDKILEELKTLAGVENAQNLEEYWLGSVGPTLYSKFIDNYSTKMWQIDSNQEFDDFTWSPKGVALNTGSKSPWEGAISAFPFKQNGYDDYFDIATKDAEVHLSTTIEEFDMEKHRVKIEGRWSTYDYIVSTISPAVLLNDAFGPLRWMGRDFFKIVLPVEKVFPENVHFLYYPNSEQFTRVVDYKQFYRNESPSTLLGIEIPSHNNQLYPYPIKAEQKVAKRYLDSLPDRVHSIGRAGAYEYRIDISASIRQSIDLVASLS